MAALTAESDGPSLSRYIQRHATLAQFREFVVQKSLYQLKEADPHTFAIPRLAGRAKAALVEIQIEMTSSLPNSRYGNGLRRLGGDAEATLFYDEHVAADAVHEQIAAHDLCGALVAAEPYLSSDVLFGAAAAETLGGRVGRSMLAAWEHGECSLRPGSPELPVAEGMHLSAVAG